MITFADEPINPPHEAFNNSVLKYSIDSGTPKASNITIDGTVFDIFPDAAGEFYFNLKLVAQVLINKDEFSDAIVPGIGDVVIQDDNLFLDMEAKIDVELTDGTIQTVTKTFPFLKSVKQLIRKKYINSQLKPLLPGTTDVSFATCFEGYPFDFGVYSDAGRTVTVTNKQTGVSTNLLLTRGVNRIFVSNGEDGRNLEALVPLLIGVNELEFVSGALSFTLFLKKKAEGCGNYLKWFNQAGGWSYWLFSALYSDQLKANTRERINKDFENIYNETGNFDITGKDAEVTREFNSGLIDENEKRNVLELFSSPKVYFYINDLSDRFADKTDFITVEASDGTYRSGNKYPLQEFKVKIDLPKQTSQTL